MKTKNLAIIFIIFLLITLVSGLAVLLTREKERPVLDKASGKIYVSDQPVAEEKLSQTIKNEPVAATAAQAEAKPTVQPEKIAPAETGDGQTALAQAVMLINGVKYEAAIKSDSSVYDLMSSLKEQRKIDFKGSNYSELGFFVEEINGIKNNPAGKNWVYYVNGKPAPVGISNYKIKNNDAIEWKYENKSF